ncbi:hypothetical protein LLD17_10685 [Lactococcus cremoris]|uniref:hypothetical protein n=1 Tax=Lactococcus lactis subsp. cremoris TaxID=1359 RepID=UPI0007B2A6B9|nr:MULTISPECIES: hypothetical protein [Lactococcus]KZK07438.1 hypothetical protein V4_1678 [Lactococcus cremoris]MCI1841615.1 hypothetical protein [Lactococcus lactis]WGU43725.1 hypothetical protein LLJM2_03395 [Lactococcus cremoris]
MNDIERQLAQTWVIVLLEILPCVYESNVHGLSEGDIIIKIKKARLEKLIFGK